MPRRVEAWLWAQSGVRIRGGEVLHPGDSHDEDHQDQLEPGVGLPPHLQLVPLIGHQVCSPDGDRGLRGVLGTLGGHYGGLLPVQEEHVDRDLGVDQEEDVEELETEGGDEVVLDEALLLLSRQDDVDKGLLLEEDEPVERGEEDYTEEHVGEVAGSGEDEGEDKGGLVPTLVPNVT